MCRRMQKNGSLINLENAGFTCILFISEQLKNGQQTKYAKHESDELQKVFFNDGHFLFHHVLRNVFKHG